MALAISAVGAADLYVVDGDGAIVHNQWARGNGSSTGGESICSTCVVAGDACCASSHCDNGLTCNASGRCETPQCGSLNHYPCTDGPRKCQPGFTVGGTGLCEQCGKFGDVCCAEDQYQCTQGYCAWDPVGITDCHHCGAQGEPICPANQAACTGTDIGPNKATGNCEHCGQTGEIACPGNVCKAAGNIPDPTSGVCEHCGDENEIACPSSTSAWGRCNSKDFAPRPGDHVCVPCGNDHQPECYPFYCRPGTHQDNTVGLCIANPPPPPPKDDPNCGKSDYAVCCKTKAACEGNRFCDSEGTCQPGGGGGGGGVCAVPGQQPATYCAFVTCSGYEHPQLASWTACSQAEAVTAIGKFYVGCNTEPAPSCSAQ
jgi:hypothetical protein